MVAFLLAPLAVPMALAAWAIAGRASRDQWILVVVAALYTYGVTLVAGIPALFVYRYMGWSRAWQFALGGFLLGVGAFIGFVRSGADAIAMFGRLGAIAALAFWAIGVRGNAAFALRRPAATPSPVAPLRLPPAPEIRRRAGEATRKACSRVERWRAAFAAWRGSRAAPGAPRPPVMGLIAVALPLLTTVGSFPWLLMGLKRWIDKLYTLGMILVLGYFGIVLMISGLTVVIAIAAIALRERYRFALAAAAVALAAIGLVILRVQMG